MSSRETPPARPRPAGPGLTRRAFLTRSAAVGAGLAVAPAAVTLAGCAGGPVPSAPPPPNVWAPVFVGELEPYAPRWVEFPLAGLPLEGSSGSGAGSGAPGSGGGQGGQPTPPEPARPVASPADAATPGTGGAWLVLGSDGTVTAFAPWCTHLLCLYDWDAAETRFHCRCHEGRYNLAGVPVQGPPPRPLWTLETRPTDDPAVIEIGWFRPA